MASCPHVQNRTRARLIGTNSDRWRRTTPSSEARHRGSPVSVLIDDLSSSNLEKKRLTQSPYSTQSSATTAGPQRRSARAYLAPWCRAASRSRTTTGFERRRRRVVIPAANHALVGQPTPSAPPGGPIATRSRRHRRVRGVGAPPQSTASRKALPRRSFRGLPVAYLARRPPPPRRWLRATPDLTPHSAPCPSELATPCVHPRNDLHTPPLRLLAGRPPRPRL